MPERMLAPRTMRMQRDKMLLTKTADNLGAGTVGERGEGGRVLGQWKGATGEDYQLIGYSRGTVSLRYRRIAELLPL